MNSTPSVAAQIIVTVVPIVGIVTGCTVIFFYLLWSFKMKMAMLEKGLYQRPKFDLDSFSLLAGLLLFCVGLGMLIFFYIKEGWTYSILGGIIPASVGLSLLVFFVIKTVMNKNGDDDRQD